MRIDQHAGKESAAKKFRTDPEISVLLLHGYAFCLDALQMLIRYPVSERENAGLNVTCASRVFLVESVVHHAFELQGTHYVGYENQI